MKRKTPMRRTSLRMSGPPTLTIKPIRCEAPGCRVKFLPVKAGRIVCSIECAVALVNEQNAKKERKAAKQAEALHRAKLADSKKLEHWLELTQRVVNHFVLVRDADKGCFTCGTHTTAQWEAGHFLTRGARPELRFDARMNIRIQCHRCNYHLSGNQAVFETKLRAEVGDAEVDLIKGPHPTAKYTREYLQGMRKTFAAETRRIERACK